MVDHVLEAVIEIVVKGSEALAEPVIGLEKLRGLSTPVSAGLTQMGRAFDNLITPIKMFNAVLINSRQELMDMARLSMTLMFTIMGLGFGFMTLASTVGAFVRPAIMEFAELGDVNNALTRGVAYMHMAISDLMFEFATNVGPTVEWVGKKFLEFSEYVDGMDEGTKQTISNFLLFATALGIVMSPVMMLLLPLANLVSTGLFISAKWGLVVGIMTSVGEAFGFVFGILSSGPVVFALLLAGITLLLAKWGLLDGTITTWGKTFGKVFDFIKIVWGFIVDLFTLGMELIGAIWEGDWNKILETLGKILGRLARFVADVFWQLVDIVINALMAIATTIWEFITLIPRLMSGEMTFGELFDAIGASISSFASGVESGINMPEATNPAEAAGVGVRGVAQLFFNITTTDPNFTIEEGGQEVNRDFYSQWR